jgi:superfamily II DNA or RNA helicase
MTSKHTAHRHLLNRGIFENLTTFAELENRISGLDSNKARGDAFEIFAEAYLATQKIALAREVWPFESIPLEQRRRLSLNTGRDMGVDGIYETTDGELRAYQVKFRSRRPALTWEELSTFMGLTDQVSQRVLFTNCDTLPSLMQDRNGFVAIRGSDLDRLTPEDFAAMREWLHSGRVELERKQPRPHQDEALASIASGLAANDRATVVMACGTGKSLVALWAAERHASKTLLVLVPSLALVRQLLHEWLRETSWEQFSFTCVCSDPSVAKGADDLVVHQADLDFPVTTDSAVVRQYLSKPFNGTRIVFSTYQSAQVVADGMPVDSEGMRQPFDLGVFDEAHKTASRAGTRFSFALEDSNLPIRQRLFFTATPRHYDVRKKDKEGDNTLVYSMDRPEVYGPVVHTLSFAEAARRGIICDYKVVISVVTSAMVDDHLLKKGEVIVDGDAVKARQVALQVALQKAVEKYGVSRIFTFHGSVKAARSFTSDDSEGIAQHLPDFNTLHVSGEMPTARREDQMKAFRQADKAVMSNARCLTEGVDVPAVDMVAFISPRKSKVDIVQATGRAMRKSPGKEFGYVMVPLFVEQAVNESIEDALKRTGFDDVWDLLGAMREQDDVLVDIIRQMQEDKGRTGGYNDSRFSERVEVLGPSVSLETIRESITAECLDSLGVSWDEWFGALQAFVADKKHSKIPRAYVTERGLALGNWIGTQRSIFSTLSQQRKLALEGLPGWSWDVYADQWDEGYLSLCEFVEKYGHARPSSVYISPEKFKLGQWVAVQRLKKDVMADDRKLKLEALSGWVWKALDEKWVNGFSRLKEYVEEFRDAAVPKDFTTNQGFRLGNWVSNQRVLREEMPEERRILLSSLPNWIWDSKETAWELGLQYLKEYAESKGDCNVPRKYVTDDGYFLGSWLGNQRQKRAVLSIERREKLEALPCWVWNEKDDTWDSWYQMLCLYFAHHGTSMIPAKYVTEEGYKLGNWVSNQRKLRDELYEDRRNKLESLGDWSWDVLDAMWEKGYKYLVEYVNRENSCLISSKFVTEEGYKLGSWVQVQRSSREKLTLSKKCKLESLNGWVWDALAEKWEIGFRYFQEFSRSEEHCNIPKKLLSADGYRVGQWAADQRNRWDSIPPERKERLRALTGWVDPK